MRVAEGLLVPAPPGPRRYGLSPKIIPVRSRAGARLGDWVAPARFGGAPRSWRARRWWWARQFGLSRRLAGSSKAGLEVEPTKVGRPTRVTGETEIGPA